MRAIVQRVARATVEVDGRIVGTIGHGLLVMLGVAKGDGASDCRFLVEKLRTLRIFADESGRMNRALTDVGGSVLLVSQFTLLGNIHNGRRPSFEGAAPPEEAKRLYDQVVTDLKAQGTAVQTGVFAAHMKVQLLNDGPVTFILDSRSGGASSH